MIILVTPHIHYPAAMPEGGPPAAPIRMSINRIKDKPTAFHLRVTQLQAAAARHLALVEGKVHMLRCIPVKVVDFQGTAAAGKTSCGKCIRPAPCPAPAVASGGLEARTGADPLLVMGTIGPNPVTSVEAIVGFPHPFDRTVWRNTFRKIEPVIGRKERPCASPLPFVGVAEPLPHGPAEKSRFPGTDPDHRVDTGNIGKLELIDAGPGILNLFNSRVVEGSHVRCPANLFKGGILVMDGRPAELFLSPIRSYRVFRDGRIPLADIPRLAKEGSNRIQLPLG